MAETTKIEWAHSTFNCWVGCTKVSNACRFCYAEVAYVTKMQGVKWGKGAPRRRTSIGNWEKPLTWNRKALKSGEPWRVFCASLADVFDPEVDDSWRADLFKLVEDTPALTWMLLTKRIELARGMVPKSWRHRWPSNVWAMTTVEDQKRADERLPELLKIPARVRGVSYEPALGPVGWNSFLQTHGIHWLIAGGESGPNARPMHPNWARSARDACADAGVAFHFKQAGAVLGKQWGCVDAKGGDIMAWPEDLRIREFPKC